MVSTSVGSAFHEIMMFSFLFFIASIMLLGALIGAIGGSLQSGRFGRKRSLLIDSTLFTLATIALTFAPNLIVVLISRFVQGYSHASAIGKTTF